jgi:hypothetical protein
MSEIRWFVTDIYILFINMFLLSALQLDSDQTLSVVQVF